MRKITDNRSRADVAELPAADLEIRELAAVLDEQLPSWFAGNFVGPVEAVVVMSADPKPYQSAEAEVAALRRRVAYLERQLERQRQSETGREQLISMLEYVPDTVFMTDREGTLLFLNRAGHKLAEIIGENAYAYIWPEHRDRYRETVERVYETGTPQPYEIRARNEAGEWSWYSCLLGPVWRDGKIVAVAGAATNVDELKRAQEALQRANAELETRVAQRTLDLAQANEVLRREAIQRQQAERERQKQTRLLELVLESMEVGVVIADRGGRLNHINPAGANILCAEGNREEALSRWFKGAYMADGCTPYPPQQSPLARALRGESVAGEEILFMHPEHWEAVWLQVSAQPLIDAFGKRYGALFVFRDVTPQRRVLTALRETEQRFVSMLENTPAIVYVKDTAGKYVLVNRAFEDAMGRPNSEVVGRTDAELFDPETAEQLRENDRKVRHSGLAFQFEEKIPVGGRQKTYLSVKFLLTDARESPYGLCGISTDISERKKSEERLRAERSFLKQLIRAHEHDRQLMAYEIHDGLVQYMSASLMHLDCVATDQQMSAKAQAALELARHLVHRSVIEGRRVMSGLRPPILDEEGIVLAISYLVAEHSSHGELQIDYHHRVSFDRLDPLLEGTLFRIAQEGLTNIRRHSRTQRAEVTLVERGNRILLEIRDWGVGFDPAQVSEDHFGLEGIRKRAELLGGQMHIATKPEGGTTITVSLPLAPAVS
ncbi:MAG TPA: PAS domain-containing protein [Pirellulales bacterium]|nr:PAS domain-containing protein [Pirellulales bacterium]